MRAIVQSQRDLLTLVNLLLTPRQKAKMRLQRKYRLLEEEDFGKRYSDLDSDETGKREEYLVQNYPFPEH